MVFVYSSWSRGEEAFEIGAEWEVGFVDSVLVYVLADFQISMVRAFEEFWVTSPAIFMIYMYFEKTGLTLLEEVNLEVNLEVSEGDDNAQGQAYGPVDAETVN